MALPLEPHGATGTLNTCLVSKERADALRQKTAAAAVIVVQPEDLPTLHAFANGLLTPLDGFMTQEQCESVLSDGTIDVAGEAYAWPVPIVLPLSNMEREIVELGERAVLVDRHGAELGTIDIESVFPWNKDAYCAGLYNTNKPEHRGVHAVRLDERGFLAGGKVSIYPAKDSNPFIAKLLASPTQSRAMLAESRCKSAVAISTSRFLLRTEEYELLHAVETLERTGSKPLGILMTNYFENEGQFVPVEMLAKAWQKLKDIVGSGDADKSIWLDDSPSFRFRLSGFRMKPHFAGYRSAVFHAILAQNLGFTHFMATSEFIDDAQLLTGVDSITREEFNRSLSEQKGKLAIEIIQPEPSAFFEKTSKVMTLRKGKSAELEPEIVERSDIEFKLQDGELPDDRFLREEVGKILVTAFEEEMSFVPLVASAPPKHQEQPSGDNIVWHSHKITRDMREHQNRHRGCTVWFTGLSGSGKSTLANEVSAALYERGIRTYILDGDNIRQGLNNDLSFSASDRKENIRRIAEVAKLFSDAGIVTLSAFISPYREDRELARQAQPDSFLEVWVKADVDVCEQRDPKGLYKKARAGEIENFTGVNAPYEEPHNADLVVDTAAMPLKKCVLKVISLLEKREIIPGFRSAETQRKEIP